MDDDEVLNRICSFLDSIGIAWKEGEIADRTFLPGLEIRDGAVVFDRKLLTHVGDVLHEAGHIALTRPDLRGSLCQQTLETQDPAQSEETGVILWTYLAAETLGIDPEVVFHAAGYKNQSNWLMDQFGSGNYIGLPLLVWMGVVEGSDGTLPRVKSWLRVSGD